MAIMDTEAGYGVISRVLHWGMAAAILAMFGLGWWMVGLDYYSPYYNSAPGLHRGLGVLVFLALAGRLAWRLVNVKPIDDEATRVERWASSFVHKAFYALLVALTVSGYLISTADGRAIDVFGVFSVPALVRAKGLEDVAGLVHGWLAYAVIGLAIVHAAAALKHHAADRRNTLTRMWSGRA